MESPSLLSLSVLVLAIFYQYWSYSLSPAVSRLQTRAPVVGAENCVDQDLAFAYLAGSTDLSSLAISPAFQWGWQLSLAKATNFTAALIAGASTNVPGDGTTIGSVYVELSSAGRTMIVTITSTNDNFRFGESYLYFGANNLATSDPKAFKCPSTTANCAKAFPDGTMSITYSITFPIALNIAKVVVFVKRDRSSCDTYTTPSVTETSAPILTVSETINSLAFTTDEYSETTTGIAGTATLYYTSSVPTLSLIPVTSTTGTYSVEVVPTTLTSTFEDLQVSSVFLTDYFTSTMYQTSYYTDERVVTTISVSEIPVTETSVVVDSQYLTIGTETSVVGTVDSTIVVVNTASVTESFVVTETPALEAVETSFVVQTQTNFVDLVTTTDQTVAVYPTEVTNTIRFVPYISVETSTNTVYNVVPTVVSVQEVFTSPIMQTETNFLLTPYTVVEQVVSTQGTSSPVTEYVTSVVSLIAASSTLWIADVATTTKTSDVYSSVVPTATRTPIVTPVIDVLASTRTILAEASLTYPTISFVPTTVLLTQAPSTVVFTSTSTVESRITSTSMMTTVIAGETTTLNVLAIQTHTSYVVSSVTSVLPASVVAAVVAPTPNCLDFGLASEFNAYLSGSYQGSSRVMGKLLVGGDALFSAGFTIGEQLKEMEHCTEDTLIIGGKLVDWPSGRNYLGNILTGSNQSYMNPYVLEPGCSMRANETVFDFQDATNQLIFMSQVMSTWQATVANVSLKEGTLRLTMSASDFMDVLSINDGKIFWKSVKEFAPLKNYTKGSMLVVNVYGDDITIASMNQEALRTIPVLFHFPNATRLYLSDIAFRGDILAPFATIITGPGTIWGRVFAKSLEGPITIAQGVQMPCNGDFEDVVEQELSSAVGTDGRVTKTETSTQWVPQTQAVGVKPVGSSAVKSQVVLGTFQRIAILFLMAMTFRGL